MSMTLIVCNDIMNIPGEVSLIRKNVKFSQNYPRHIFVFLAQTVAFRPIL